MHIRWPQCFCLYSADKFIAAEFAGKPVLQCVIHVIWCHSR